MQTFEIGYHGERLALWELEKAGFECELDTKAPGGTDIEARAIPPKASRLVQVKTAMFPKEPADLSPDALRDIKSRAAKLGIDAYLAQVQIQADGELWRRIRWVKLN